ncbi:hypothetical protein B5F36_10460 [Anaerofilum sp. An201]|nr:BRO family protein [Anaerofilum sp. An201]OUP02643.1 hypothetical protein B5F36_10460 [Anaerofilum sp. An201]
MNDLQIFIYGGEQLRTIQQPDGLWWVLRDVCRVLGLSTPARVAERLDDDEKGVSLIHTPGGDQKVTIINEPGLYAVILRSDKPQAKAFKRWVTHEVLPSIRRTGAYGVPPERLAQLNELQARLEEWREREREFSRLTTESRKWYESNRDWRDKCRAHVQAYETAIAAEIKALQN